MNSRMITMLSVCGVLFGGIFGFKWFGNRMMNQAFDNMSAPPATVSATRARQEAWTRELGAIGTLRAVDGTEVTTEAAGIIDAIRFESGDAVERGAVLVTLDSSTDRAELAALQARSELAQQELERAERLYERNAVSKSELDQRAAAAAADRANVEAQRARIAQKIIRAPFSGVLGIRRVDLGQHIAPGTPIVTLQSLDPIYVDFRLPQQLSGRVQEGLAVAAGVDGLDKKPFHGDVTAVEPRIDPSTRNFMVRATLANTGHLLRPGMFARVEIDLGTSENVIVIPQTAVSYNPYGDSVWVISEQPDAQGNLTAQRRLITTGRRRGDLVAVAEGLSEGEQIATSGLLKLRNGTLVLINNDVQPSADIDPAPPNS